MKRLIFCLLALTTAATSAHAATFLIPDDHTLVMASRAIVVATAGTSHGRWSDGGWIETATAMQVEETIKGPLRVGETFDEIELGGAVDGIGYAVAGAPRFVTGERLLLFLELTDRGDWTAKNMAVGRFSFTTDGAGRQLLLRESRELAGWDVGGGAHREPQRLAEPFLRFVRETARGHNPAIDYVAPTRTTNGLAPTSNATPSITSYLLQNGGSSGTLGIRWSTFPSTVTFVSHGSQPGASNGGLTSMQRGFSAWTDDPGSNVVYVYGGTTNVSSGFKGADGVNSVQFNDPSNEIPGAFTGTNGDTLAIGGAWFATSGSGATHTYQGETFYTITEADLIVQNGISGSGLTGNGFDHVLTHELGHTLGLRHSDEPPAGGTSTSNAIMNSSVDFDFDSYGATLQAWDREAIDAVYGATAACMPPAITQQPQSVALVNGPVTLSVTASGSLPLTYQWYAGARGSTTTPLAGATSASISIKPTVTGTFWVRVSNNCDPPADSDVATITVNGCPAVSISDQSEGLSIIEGTSMTLSVTAAGGTLSYQWYLGTSGSTAQPIGGATGSTLTVKPAASTPYWARVSNDCGASADSETIGITVVPCTPVQIVVSPIGGQITTGSTGIAYVSATGSGTLHYQWFAGAPGNTLTPTGSDSPTITTNGSAWVRITNPCGSADSRAATFSETATCSAPRITTQPQNTDVAPGNMALVSVEASAVNADYRWYQGDVFDFSKPVGGSSPILLTPPINSATKFWVHITTPCGDVNSSAATITPNETRRRVAGH